MIPEKKWCQQNQSLDLVTGVNLSEKINEPGKIKNKNPIQKKILWSILNQFIQHKYAIIKWYKILKEIYQNELSENSQVLKIETWKLWIY